MLITTWTEIETHTWWQIAFIYKHINMHSNAHTWLNWLICTNTTQSCSQDLYHKQWDFHSPIHNTVAYAINICNAMSFAHTDELRAPRLQVTCNPHHTPFQYLEIKTRWDITPSTVWSVRDKEVRNNKEVLERTNPPTFPTLFNKLNSLKRYDTAQNYTILHSVCLNVTSKFCTIDIV
jgi:hypothetical protein